MKHIVFIALLFIGFTTQAQIIVSTPSGATKSVLASSRMFTLSKWGAVSNASLAMNATTTSLGTDNTAAIQAILDSAVNGPIWIIVDGQFSCDSLRIRSNTRLTLLPNCGLVQRDSVRVSFIANKNRTSGAIIDSNIIIDGTGVINARGHTSTGAENRQYFGTLGFNTILNFRGVNQLTVRDIQLINSRTFMSMVSNANYVKFENMTIDQNHVLPFAGGGILYNLNHDGIRFIGPLTNLSVKNISMYSVDDALVVSPNDGLFPTPFTDGNGENLFDAYASYGSVKDVAVDGFIFRGGYHGIRIISASDTLDRVSFSNLSGTVNENIAIIDTFYNPGIYKQAGKFGGYIGDIKFNNLTVDLLQNTISNTTNNAAFSIGCYIKNFSFSNVNYSGYTASTYPFFKQGANSTIDRFYADNVRIAEDSLSYKAFTFNGTVNKKDGIFSKSIASGSALNLFNTGIGRDASVKNLSTTNNLADVSIVPRIATNAGVSFSLTPSGTGLNSTFSTQFILDNSDRNADAVNYDQLIFRAAGTNGYGIGNSKGGTNTLKNFWLDGTGNVSPTNANILLASDTKIGGSGGRFTVDNAGKIGFGTTSPVANIDVAIDNTKSSAKFGSMEAWNYAVNNGGFGENMYFNTSNFVYRATGYATLFYFLNGGFSVRALPSASAGTTTGASNNNILTLDLNGNGSIGGVSPYNATTGAYMTFNTGGKIGIGLTTPTAILQLKAGTATANTAPFKFTSGTNLTTPEDGAVEYNGTDYQGSVGSTRYILAKTLQTSGTLDFASTAAQSSTDLTITATGAVLNDEVSVGVPNGAMPSNSSFSAWVSASNTITIRYNNYSNAAQDPVSGTFRVSVIKH